MINAHASRQLDLFRGFAAILMVLNHAGYELLSPSNSGFGFDGALVFLGSAAPALFFSATGIGAGLSRQGAPYWPGVWRKVLLLLLADLFLNWSVRRWLGLDFFGFCAVSMLAVAAVSMSRRPVLVACAAIAACLASRYCFVPALEPLAFRYPAVAFVTGIGGVVGVSYPLGPWLAFPLGGFVLGGLYSKDSGRRIAVFLWIGAVICLGAAVSIVARGGALHRWNSVSIAYFFFAVGFVGVMWLSAGWLSRDADTLAVRAIAMRGPASLLVVPLHYALLGIAVAWVGRPWNPSWWPVLAVVLCAVVLKAARWMASGLLRATAGEGFARGWLPALAPALALAAWAVVSAPPLICLLAGCAGEVLVAGNLTRRGPITSAAGVARAL